MSTHREILTSGNLVLVHRERSIVRGVIQLGLVEIRNNLISDVGHLTTLHSHIVLHVVNTLTQARLRELTNGIDTVEELATSHRHQRVVTIFQITDSKRFLTIVILLNQTSIAVIKNTYDCRVVGSDVRSLDATELLDSNGHIGTVVGTYSAHHLYRHELLVLTGSHDTQLGALSVRVHEHNLRELQIHLSILLTSSLIIDSERYIRHVVVRVLRITINVGIGDVQVDHRTVDVLQVKGRHLHERCRHCQTLAHEVGLRSSNLGGSSKYLLTPLALFISLGSECL